MTKVCENCNKYITNCIKCNSYDKCITCTNKTYLATNKTACVKDCIIEDPGKNQ